MHFHGIRLNRLGIEMEAQQTAFQRAVEQRVRAIRAQPQFPPERRIAGEHRRLPIGKTGQQLDAERPIERRERLLVAESHAVRRIDEHEARLLRRFLEVRDVAPLEHEVIAEASAVGVGNGRPHRALLPVVAAAPADAKLRVIALGTRRILQRLPGGRVVLPPALEPEPPAQQARRDPRGDQRRLDHQRAGPAHRVDERPAAGGDLAPAGSQQQCRREILLERGLDARLPIAATVQRLAAQVDADGCALAREPDVDAQVRALRVDRGSRTCPLAKSVDDRVLHLERGKLRVAKPGGLSPTVSTISVPSGAMCSSQGICTTRRVQGFRRIGRHIPERQDAPGSPCANAGTPGTRA